MAIINCPVCNQRISDKAKSCSHCDSQFSTDKSVDGLTPEQLESKEKITRLKKRNSLQMQAMAGIIVFLVGIVLWYFLGEMGVTKLSHYLELGLAAVGGFWYLITRIRLILFKKSSL